MSGGKDYDPAADGRSRAYLAVLEVRDLLYGAGLGREGEAHVEALVRLIGRSGHWTAAGDPRRSSG